MTITPGPVDPAGVLGALRDEPDDSTWCNTGEHELVALASSYPDVTGSKCTKCGYVDLIHHDDD